MRGFLTYLLAAPAAALANQVWALLNLGGKLREALAPNDPRIIAGTISQAIVSFISLSLAYLVVMGGLWFGLRFVLRKIFGDMATTGAIATIALSIALFVTIPMLMTVPLLQEYGMTGGILFGSLLSAAPPLISAGLAWGVVFWLRTPKVPSNLDNVEVFS